MMAVRATAAGGGIARLAGRAARASLGVAAGLLAAWPAAADCGDYREGPSRIAILDPAPAVIRLASVGDYVYYAGQTSYVTYGLTVVDFTDPAQPRVRGELTNIRALDVAASDGVAIAPVTAGWIGVMDLTYPMAPWPVDTVTGFTSPQGVATGPGRAYVVDAAGLHVLDVSNPDETFIAGSTGLSAQGSRVARDGMRVYVTAPSFGLLVVDAQDAAAPAQVGSLALSGGALDAAVPSADRALVLTASALHVVDLTNPASPVEAGLVPLAGVLRAVAADGDLAFVTASDGVTVIDVSVPVAPAPRYVIPLADGRSAAAAAGRLWAANGNAGIEGWDLRAGLPLSPIAALDLGGELNAVAAQGTLLAVLERFGGVRLVDVTDPATPTPRGWQNVADNAEDLAISGTHAYVAAFEAGLEVVDISDPDAPFFAGRLDTPDLARAIVVEGNRAYLADWRFGVEVVDISDPAAPVVTGSVYAGSATDLALAGDALYVATTQELVVLDVSSPDDPVIAGSAFRPSSYGFYPLATWGSHLYAGLSRLQVLDISVPLAPVVVDSLPFDAEVLAVRDGILYAGSRTGLVAVFDLAQPGSPELIGTTFLPGAWRGFAPTGAGIAAVGEAGELALWPLQCPLRRRPRESALEPPDGHDAIQAWPSPFRTETFVAFDLERPGTVSLSLFDVRGRRLVDLGTGRPLAAGPQRIRWDGRDREGRLVPAGVYFVRLEGAGAPRTTSVRLVR